MFRKLIRLARVAMAGADDKQFPAQQVSYLGKTADAMMAAPYGIHGNAPPDTLVVMLSAMGNPDNRVCVASAPKDRPQLAEGETAFYHPPTGSFIIWRQSGALEIVTEADITAKCANATITASGSVTIDSPTVTFTGNATVQGGLTVEGDTTLAGVTSNGKDISDQHKHTSVTTGGGVSGPVQ